jgi:hypothetical protein
VLTGFTISPQAVDSRDGAKRVTFTVTGHDTGGPGPATGLRDAVVYLGLGDGVYNISVNLKPTTSDTLVGTLVVLEQFRTANRTVEGIEVGDWAGNRKSYDHAALAELGFPNTMTTVTHFDTTKPQLRSLKLSTTSVDTRRHARRIRVTARVSDDSAGVMEVLVGFKDLAFAGIRVETRLKRTAGTARNGVWTGSLLVRRWQGTDTHQLHVLLYDRVRNQRSYRPEKLHELGLPSVVRIRSASDVTPPHGRVRSVTPDTVTMTGGADGRLIVMARIRDLVSGVGRVVVSLIAPDSSSSSQVRMVRISGTAQDGRWRAVMPLDRCAIWNGAWSLTVGAMDRSGQNSSELGQRLVQVSGDDVIRPQVSIVDEYQVPRAGPVVLRFNEDVVGIDSSSAVVHAGTYDRFSYHYAPTIEPGTWTCTDVNDGAVDCVAGPVRTAQFHPTAPLIAGVDQTVVFNPEHVLAVTDLAGNPFLPGGPGFHTRG